jgi:hypothetical protein
LGELGRGFSANDPKNARQANTNVRERQ